MTRRELMALFGAGAAWPLSAIAQAPKVPRIGYLTGSLATNPHLAQGFRQGLRDLGYVEGRTILIEYRDFEGHYARLPALAADLLALNVDAVMATGTPHALALKQMSGTLPIVAVMADPVASGLAETLARPGGNVTGLSLIVPDIAGKCLELLKQAVPSANRIAYLWHPGDYGEGTERHMLNEAEATARALGVQLQRVQVRGPEDFEQAFSDMVSAGVGGLTILGSNILILERRRLVELAAKHRLPAVYSFREFADSGGLMSYGANFADLCRRAAQHVDKVLRGAKPGDIPIEQPTKFDLVLNLKTARALDVTIPPMLLARANEVIE